MNPLEIFAPGLAGLFVIPIVLGLARAFGIYIVINEREAKVFTLFGKVLGTMDRPGLHFPFLTYGPRSLLIPFFGKRHDVSTALRQHYLRGQMDSEGWVPLAFIAGFKRLQAMTNDIDFMLSSIADSDQV